MDEAGAEDCAIARLACHHHHGARGPGRARRHPVRPGRHRPRRGQLQRERRGCSRRARARWPGSTASPAGWTPGQDDQRAGAPDQVSQTDRFLILRDLTTGQVSSLDLATLQIAATTRHAPRGSASPWRSASDAAFIVDAVQGIVRQLDPVDADPGRRAGALPAGHHRRHVRRQRAAVARGAERGHRGRRSAPRSCAARQRRRRGPARARSSRTRPVADPSHDLALSTLDNGVAVLDRTAAALTTVRGGKAQTIRSTLTGAGRAAGRAPAGSRCR